MDQTQSYVNIPDEVNPDIVISCDDETETSGLLSDEEIVLQGGNNEDEASPPIHVPVYIVSPSDALTAIDTLHSYLYSCASPSSSFSVFLTQVWNVCRTKCIKLFQSLIIIAF